MSSTKFLACMEYPRTLERDERDTIKLIDDSKVLLIQESLEIATDVDQTVPMEISDDALPAPVVDMIEKHEKTTRVPDEEPPSDKPVT